jgi:hypothetical protein
VIPDGRSIRLGSASYVIGLEVHDHRDRPFTSSSGTELPERGRKNRVGILIDDLWRAVPIREDEWVVAYRILSQEGTPVIGEVRLIPNEPNRRVSGEWSGVL